MAMQNYCENNNFVISIFFYSEQNAYFWGFNMVAINIIVSVTCIPACLG